VDSGVVQPKRKPVQGSESFCPAPTGSSREERSGPAELSALAQRALADSATGHDEEVAPGEPHPMCWPTSNDAEIEENLTSDA